MDPPPEQVVGEIGGSARDALDDRVRDAGEMGVERVEDVGAGYHHLPDRPRARVAAVDLGLHLVELRAGAADRQLDPLGRLGIDHEVLVADEVGADRRVEVVAAEGDGGSRHDASERQHRNVGLACTHVHHHRRDDVGDREPGGEGTGDRVLDEVDSPRPGVPERAGEGAALDAGRTGRDAREHGRPAEARAGNPAHDALQHPLGQLEVDELAVTDRADELDETGRGADEREGAAAELEQPPGAEVDGGDGRLLKDEALLLAEHPGRRGAEVDGEIAHGRGRPRPRNDRGEALATTPS